MSGMDADIFEQFIDQLQRYVRERLIPAEKEIIETDMIPDAILNEMRDMGLFGLTMPEEYGGAGLSVSQYCRTIRELAYAMPCFRSIISINIGMVCSALKNGGTAEQKAEWLPRLAAGEIASFGLTEPGSGSDSAGMQTMAVRKGNGWVLNGTKRYITNSPFAKVALIMARTSKEALPKNAHVSAFIVPMDTPGVSVGKS
jgi:acyl-CoA dehydrogenase